MMFFIIGVSNSILQLFLSTFYHEWKSICENFVINVKHTMPEYTEGPPNTPSSGLYG